MSCLWQIETCPRPNTSHPTQALKTDDLRIDTADMSHTKSILSHGGSMASSMKRPKGDDAISAFLTDAERNLYQQASDVITAATTLMQHDCMDGVELCLFLV